MVSDSKENNVKPVSGWLFYGLLLLLLLPLFRLSVLFTHDGPAHVFNSVLIRELISGNILVSDFIQMKLFPEPNWTGHFFLAFTGIFFPAVISEKIFLGFYIFCLPFFFRKLILKINPASGLLSLLVFPFVYSYFFFGGLYNFLAGLTVLFAALVYILPLMDKNENKKYRLIFLFSMLLYFSHLVSLGIFFVMIFIAQVFVFRQKEIPSGKFRMIPFLKFSFPAVIALLPSLILLAVFFSAKLFISSGHSSVSFPEMLESLYFISPVITLQFNPENYYSLVIFFLFVYLIYTGISGQLRSTVKPASPVFYKRSSYWAIACLLMLAFYFIIPDQAATGGVIKFRFELIFFLFLILLLCTLPIKKLQRLLIIFLIPVWMILKLIYLFPLMQNLDKEAQTVMHCTDHMRENSILLPLNYSSNWMHCNIFNYAGTVKNIFVLDNYEAGMPHFPLEWKPGRNPVAIMGNFNIDPPPLCANVFAFEKQTHHNIDYIVVWKYHPLTDSCTINIQSILSSGYHLIYSENEDLKLYERN